MTTSTFTAAQKKKVTAALSGLKGYRKTVGQNQQTFWPGYGVTQSGGSRYETGRGMDKPLKALIALRASGKIDAEDLAEALKIAEG